MGGGGRVATPHPSPGSVLYYLDHFYKCWYFSTAHSTTWVPSLCKLTVLWLITTMIEVTWYARIIVTVVLGCNDQQHASLLRMVQLQPVSACTYICNHHTRNLMTQHTLAPLILACVCTKRQWSLIVTVLPNWLCYSLHLKTMCTEEKAEPLLALGRYSICSFALSHILQTDTSDTMLCDSIWERATSAKH